MPRRRYKNGRNGRSVSTSPRWCAICGLPIPPDIVAANHHLFGTIDHLTPLSKGGTDEHFNRVAAHAFCNGQKGDQLVVSFQQIESWRGQIRRALELRGIHTTNKQLQAARKRSIHPVFYPPGWFNYKRRGWMSFGYDRWLDDGGAAGEND